MNVVYDGVTDVGRLRSVNEDCLLLQPVLDGKYLLSVVADGVGGTGGGDIASRLACETMLSYVDGATENESIADLLSVALVNANNAIVEQHANPFLSHMTTVLTAALLNLENGEMHVCHVGDTRLYAMRKGKLYKLTSDHSVVGPMEERGALTEEQAMCHPRRNLITRSVGKNPLRFGTDFIQSMNVKLNPPCTVLMCSDGLYDMVHSSQVVKILSSDDDVATKVGGLVNAANAAGGKDNITVAVIELE